MQGGWVYILANRKNGVPYVGATSDLPHRIHENQSGSVAGLSKRYEIKRLVYAEHHDDIRTALQREKNFKHWPRAWRVRLIQGTDPGWDDHFDPLA